jgi:hypothetical protein
MSSAEPFNTVMHAFLVDLTDVFPENDAILASLENFDQLVQINFKKPRQMFIETVGKFAEQIAKRDEAIVARVVGALEETAGACPVPWGGAPRMDRPSADRPARRRAGALASNSLFVG